MFPTNVRKKKRESSLLENITGSERENHTMLKRFTTRLTE